MKEPTHELYSVTVE